MYCHQCGKELYETDDPEPYPWIVVETDVFCLTCSKEE
jgi:hypothetical protein